MKMKKKIRLWAFGICLISLTLSSGCSTGLFYLPDEPFCELTREDVCETPPVDGVDVKDNKNGKDKEKACKEAHDRYIKTLQWAKEVREAYSVRADFNRLSNYIAAGVGATGGTAVTGLAAFDKSDSDAAKIVPIASGLVAGIFALMDNDALANAYLDACKGIDDAISNNRPGGKVTGNNSETKENPMAYDEATHNLANKVNEIINDLDKKRVKLSNTPDALMVEDIVENVMERLNKKK